LFLTDATVTRRLPGCNRNLEIVKPIAPNEAKFAGTFIIHRSSIKTKYIGGRRSKLYSFRYTC